MSVLRNTITRSNVLSSVSRNILVRQYNPAAAAAAVVTRSFTLLATKDNHPKCYYPHHSRRWFAASVPFADLSKSDDSWDKAQQYMEEGVSFQSNNMLPLAMSSFQKSINVRPTGDYQSSINSFQESLKLSPHHADVHTNIATAHIKLNGDMKEALSHLQAAANIAPQDAEIQFNLAVISEQSGDFDTAIIAYQAAVDIGLEQASMNLRNVKTKKFAKLAKEAEFKDSKE
ncbi:hypothetical protein BGZ65_011198 [Modicella reniformis]|uniref:Uncharacterized protein n=1 Tax=Modicella reniformis TaxID=1440133 RepID=A0A9P6J3M5_9FUNG|nr:hypothetical protein BGZ65_011198 [Modicella reniformis]